MKSFTLALASILLVACGSSFTGDQVTGGAGGNERPDASAGAAGTGGDGAGGSSAGGSSVTGGSSGAAGATSAGASGSGGSAGVGGSAASGGSSGSGGSAGSGGRGGSAGSGGSTIDAGRDTGTSDGGPTPCKIDSECKLVDTCCLGCVAKGADFPVPPCSLQCIVDPCQGMSVKGVRCFEGSCALANECDASAVACASAPPPCPAGEVPSVTGACWSGHCVKASSCRTVKDCSSCDSSQYICVRTEMQLAVTIRCIDIPATCGATRSCACAAPYACMSPFTTCNESGGGNQLNCSCPNC